MMKYLYPLTVFVIIVNTSSAASNDLKEEKNENLHTSSSVFASAVISMFIDLSRTEWEGLVGRRLILRERIALSILKFNARHQQKREQTRGFNVEGFLVGFAVTVLGVFLGLFGLLAFGILGLLLVIGNLIFSKDNNYQKWLLLGWLAGIIVSLFILFIRMSSSG